MPVNTRWFQDRLSDRGMSQRGLARALGLDAAAVSLMLRGKRQMKLTEAADIARLLGVPVDDVLASAGVRLDSGGAEVPLDGYIDGAGEFHFERMGSVPHPGAGIPVDVSAVQCRTAGSPLAHMDGWLLFGHAKGPASGVPADAIGRMSWCRLKNGVIFLAAPTRSYHRGKWNLDGPAASSRDVELEWATPVILIVP
jgi:transcriptional regulator with XRE-family HTH domain